MHINVLTRAQEHMAKKRRDAEAQQRKEAEQREQARAAEGSSGGAGGVAGANARVNKRKVNKKQTKKKPRTAPWKTAAENRLAKKKARELHDFKVACRAARRARMRFLSRDATAKKEIAEKYEEQYQAQLAYVDFLKDAIDGMDRSADRQAYDKMKALWERNNYRLDKLVLKMNFALGGPQALDEVHTALMLTYDKMVYGKSPETWEPETIEKKKKFLHAREVRSDRDSDVDYYGEVGFYAYIEEDEDEEDRAISDESESESESEPEP